jgi:hypothetical protein
MGHWARSLFEHSDDKKVATHMLLNDRQQKAKALAAAIDRMGGWVRSPMPLNDDSKLRFQVLDTERERLLELLRSWEWQPAFCGPLPRVTFTGMQTACV